MKNIYYAIAESDFIFRKTISDSICINPLYRLKAAVGNGYELIRVFNASFFDVLFIDLYMPVLSGIETINIIKISNPSVIIFCWSTTFQQDIFDKLSQYSFVIYCEKRSSSILNVVDNYLKEGEIFYQKYIEIWKKTSEEKIENLFASKPINFSPMELKLMKFTYEGFTNKEIAEKMLLSKRTVDTYINRLTERLGLRTKTDLIKYTIENGLYNTSM